MTATKHYTRKIRIQSVETLSNEDGYTHVVNWNDYGYIDEDEEWYCDALDALDAYKKFIDYAENQEPYWKVVRDGG